MFKFINSLLTKLILSFVLLIVVIAGGTFLFTYGQTKKALLDITRQDLLQMIGIVSTQFSNQEIDAIVQLKTGQDTAPEYITLQNKMQQMRSLSKNLVNFYIMRLEGDKVIFLLDDAMPGEDPALIGQAYQEPEAKLFEASAGPTVSDNTYTDEWGTYLSGYAPVKDASGRMVFIVGVDMEATTVIQRQNFIGNTIYLIMGIGILLAAMIIGVFSVTIIRDIKKLNLAAEKISMGDTDVRVDVHRKDEIGDLAASFERMVASLKIMMAVDSPTDSSTVDESAASREEKSGLI
jgi:methyl-accepting chemotaxis protein